MPPQPRPYLYWIIIALLVIYSVPITFYAVKAFRDSSAALVGAPPADKLFKIQTAVIEGKIDSINGNKLSVTNREGLKGTVEVSETVSINDFNNPLASPSSNLQKLQTGKDATIYLNLVSGIYKVTNITYQTFTAPLLLNLPSMQPQQTDSQPQGQTSPNPIINLPSMTPVLTPPIPASNSATPPKPGLP